MYHQQRRNDPIHQYAETELYPDLTMLKELMQAFVSDLEEHWIHHN